jgi:hypothetical protein
MATLITDQDLEILSWLGRHRFASAPQVARWSGRPAKVAYRRLAAMRDRDLVAYERPTIDHGVYVATRAGLRLAGLELPPSGVDIRSYHHDKAVLELALALEADGHQLVTEREMRHRDESALRARERPTYGVALPGRSDYPGLHYPDLAIELSQGQIRAIEMERTAKNRARLERILAGYARARHVAQVVYYVPGRRVGDHIARTARAVGADPVVSVSNWPGWGRLPEAANG